MRSERLAAIQKRVDLVKSAFPTLIAIYDDKAPFTKSGQREFHQRTIAARRAAGSVAAALASDSFIKLLYETLQRWGIGMRGSHLRSLREFSASLRDCQAQIVDLEPFRIDDQKLDVAGTSRRIMELIKRLRLVDNKATLVPCTKALHHLLPDLVVPVDREYTQRFFGWHNPEFQSGQERCYMQSFAAFAEIARATDPAQYVRPGSWHTCTAKVLDNAIVSLLVLATELGKDGAG